MELELAGDLDPAGAVGGSLVAVRAAGSGGGRSTAALVELELADDLDPARARWTARRSWRRRRWRPARPGARGSVLAGELDQLGGDRGPGAGGGRLSATRARPQRYQ